MAAANPLPTEARAVAGDSLIPCSLFPAVVIARRPHVSSTPAYNLSPHGIPPPMSFIRGNARRGRASDNDPGPHTDRLQRQLGSGARRLYWWAPPSAAASSACPARSPGTWAPWAPWRRSGCSARLALFGALTLAELAALFPRSGGIYVFLREAYGPLPRFCSDGPSCWSSAPPALGGIAMLFAEYCALVAFGPEAVRRLAAAAIFPLARGQHPLGPVGRAGAERLDGRQGGRAGGAGAARVRFSATAPRARSRAIEWSPTTWGGFGIALVAVMWAYDGWADLTFLAGEVKDPGARLPRALLGGTVAIVVIYLIVNAAYLFVLPLAAMAGTPLVAADAARTHLRRGRRLHRGRHGDAVRVRRAQRLDDDGAAHLLRDGGGRPVLPAHRARCTRASRRRSSRSRWRRRSGIGYVSLRSFEQLADAFILGIWPFYALAVGAVFLPAPHAGPTWSARTARSATPWCRSSFCSRPSPCWATPSSSAGATLFGFGVILVGIPVYFIWRAIKGRQAASSQDGGPADRARR